MSEQASAAPVRQRFLGALATFAAAAFALWALLTAPRPLWPEPASPTSYPRGDYTLPAGGVVTATLDPRGGAWDALELRLAAGAHGPLVATVTDRMGRSRFSGQLVVDEDPRLALPFPVGPEDGPLVLELHRPPEAGPLVLAAQHRSGLFAPVYQWYRRWPWREIAGEIARQLPQQAALLAALLSWLLVPGWLVWRWLGGPLGRPARRTGVGLVALWVGLSAALLLVAGALWSFGPVRLPRELTPWVLRLLSVVLAVVGLSALVRWGWRSWPQRPSLRRWVADGSLALLLVAGGLVATRAGALVGLGGAPGVDGTAVCEFARRIIERGALLDVSPAAVANRADFYHLGLSGLVALVSLVAGAPLDVAFLATGQAMQLAALAGLALLVVQWRGSAWAAAAALVMAGWVLPLPGFLLAWSRFTQIAGLALLPPLFALAAWALSARQPARLAAATALVGAGVALLHYRALAFALGALPVLLLFPPPGQPLRWRNVGVLLLAASLAVLLLAPWVVGVALTFWLPAVAEGPGGPQEFPAWTLQYGGGDWVLAGVALASGLLLLTLRTSALARPLAPILWVAAVLALFTWSGVVGFRLGLAVNPLSAAIAYYLPVGLWVGWVVGVLSAQQIGGGRLAPAATLAVVGLLALASNRPGTLGARLPELLWYADADRRALAWVASSLPTNARLANNGEPWAYGLYVGTDGGYWAQPFSGRETLIPPLAYAYHASAERAQRTDAIAAALALSDRPAELVRWLAEHGWTHLYLGRRGGPIDPWELARTPGVMPIYQEEGVSIWALAPPVAQQSSTPPERFGMLRPEAPHLAWGRTE
ncbi:MAG: hypothetical protein KatS3mg061_1135 [Dehalococcoidia bacterium]|nr:MAG: hypothetical protein KatS3mg061_1135 [Dehalococcoidia bacterium]